MSQYFSRRGRCARGAGYPLPARMLVSDNGDRVNAGSTRATMQSFPVGSRTSSAYQYRQLDFGLRMISGFRGSPTWLPAKWFMMTALSAVRYLECCACSGQLRVNHVAWPPRDARCFAPGSGQRYSSGAFCSGPRSRLAEATSLQAAKGWGHTHGRSNKYAAIPCHEKE